MAISAYFAPGTYLRPKRTDLPDVRIVRTDVAGFVGYAERGPLPLPSLAREVKPWQPEDLAVRLTSWDEFRATFGGVIRNGYLAYAVRGFFENGGQTCHVVRVAAADAKDPAERPSFARWVFAALGAIGGGTLGRPASSGARTLTASAPVTAGNALLVEVAAPGGGLVERHVLGEVNGPELRLAAPLRASFPAGSLVVFREAAMIIEATSAGSWGNRIGVRIQPSTADDQVAKFSLRITVDPGPDRDYPREEEPYPQLSLDPDDVAYVARVVNARSRLVRIATPPPPASGARYLAMDRFTAVTPRLRLEGGRDGLRSVTAASFGLFGSHELAGLRALEAIDQVSILCAPDAMLEPPPPVETRPVPSPPCAPPGPDVPEIEVDETAAPQAVNADDVYAEMLAQCQRQHDRVAILDPPPITATTELLRWRDRLRFTRVGATYAPWILAPDSLQPRGSFRAIPPSGHVAGVYAMNDLTRGVHHPPANMAIEGIANVVEPIGLTAQETLNPHGVNVLRAFPGSGIRVWGARSLAGLDDGVWRFIHVRRLMSMIEESVEDSMQWAAFEPNDDTLRRAVVHAVSLFLNAIWVDGGLKGAQPEEGFYVKCDETNNPQAVVDAGQLVCEVGVAAAAPMEFIVFELRQTPEGAQITEL